MSKKKKPHPYRRNAAPAAARPASRAASSARDVPEDTSLRRLAYAAAGATGASLLGSFMAREGWLSPRAVAGALTAVGAGLAWKGDGAPTQSLGTGAMSAAGSQLVYMTIADHDTKQDASPPKLKNADALPAGALGAAYRRALADIDVRAAH